MVGGGMRSIASLYRTARSRLAAQQAPSDAAEGSSGRGRGRRGTTQVPPQDDTEEEV